MIWIHIIADFYEIPENILNIDSKTIKDLVSREISNNSLQELGSYYHTFEKQNEITWVIALAESHVTFHIWPEKKYMSLDIFVCNFWTDNTKKAQQLYTSLFDYFQPGSYEVQEIQRNSKKSSS